jgi:hypothetical protein
MARKRVPKGKRIPLNMRTTQELRDRIEAAARASGRSLVQEVEYRVEQSFKQEAEAVSIEETFDEHVVAETMVNLFSPPDPHWPFSPEFARVLLRGGYPFPPGKAAIAISKLSRKAGITPDEYLRRKIEEAGYDLDKPYRAPPSTDKPDQE